MSLSPDPLTPPRPSPLTVPNVPRRTPLRTCARQPCRVPPPSESHTFVISLNTTRGRRKGYIAPEKTHAPEAERHVQEFYHAPMWRYTRLDVAGWGINSIWRLSHAMTCAFS